MVDGHGTVSPRLLPLSGVGSNPPHQTTLLLTPPLLLVWHSRKSLTLRQRQAEEGRDDHRQLRALASAYERSFVPGVMRVGMRVGMLEEW